MKIIIISITTLLVVVLNAQAQSTWLTKNTASDITFATNANQYLSSLGINKLHGLGSKKRFKIGYGIRFNASFSGSVEYITAPARLTSGRTDPGVLFSSYILENLDTLTLANAQVFSLNSVIYLHYTLNERWGIQFNIDAIGFSFGPSRRGTFRSAEQAQFNGLYTANPTSFNLLLISDNDIGSLNSELMAYYTLSEHFKFKLGLAFNFFEVRTSETLTFDNDRFRSKALMPALGLSYVFH